MMASLSAGRYVAIDRGAFDTEPEVPVTPIALVQPRGPMAERLSGDSLAALASITGLTVAQLLDPQRQTHGTLSNGS